MNELTVGSLFSGIGLLDYGLCLAGLGHSWGCEAGVMARWDLAENIALARQINMRDAERNHTSEVVEARQAVAAVHRDVELGFRNVPVLAFEGALAEAEREVGVA